MNRNYKKLGLNRETLRHLRTSQLAGVAGGAYHATLICGDTGLCTGFGGCTVPNLSGACTFDCTGSFC